MGSEMKRNWDEGPAFQKNSRKAAELYDLAVEMQEEENETTNHNNDSNSNNECVVRNKLFFLSCLNNLKHAHKLTGNKIAEEITNHKLRATQIAVHTELD